MATIANFNKNELWIVQDTRKQRYRCRSLYGAHQQDGAGLEECADLTECVVTLLQVEAEHHAQNSAGEAR